MPLWIYALDKQKPLYWPLLTTYCLFSRLCSCKASFLITVVWCKLNFRFGPDCDLWMEHFSCSLIIEQSCFVWSEFVFLTSCKDVLDVGAEEFFVEDSFSKLSRALNGFLLGTSSLISPSLLLVLFCDELPFESFFVSIIC